MPNHLHALLYLPDGSNALNKIISNGKRFMAYETIMRLEKLNQFELLSFLKNGVLSNEKKSGKIHQVFQPSFDAKS